jgi:hypothetical protein
LPDFLAADRGAGVAQLVEHHVANVVVVGSNPITRSIFVFGIPQLELVGQYGVTVTRRTRGEFDQKRHAYHEHW